MCACVCVCFGLVFLALGDVVGCVLLLFGCWFARVLHVGHFRLVVGLGCEALARR